MNIQELFQKRNKALTEMRKILDAHSDGKLPADKRQEYDKWENEFEHCDRLIKQEQREHKLLADANGAIVPRGAVANFDTNFSASADEIRAHSHGAIKTLQPGELRGYFPPLANGERRITPQALGLPEDRQALEDIRDYLRKGALSIREDQRQRLEARALQADLDVAGGYLIGEQLAAQVIMSLEDAVFMRRLGTVLLVPDASSLGVAALESDPEDADWTAELRTSTEDDEMSFGKRELRPHPLAKRIKASKTLIPQGSQLRTDHKATTCI